MSCSCSNPPPPPPQQQCKPVVLSISDIKMPTGNIDRSVVHDAMNRFTTLSNICPIPMSSNTLECFPTSDDKKVWSCIGSPSPQSTLSFPFNMLPPPPPHSSSNQ